MIKDHWKEYWACLALRHTSGVGARTCSVLLQAYGSALDAAMDARSWHARGLATQKQATAFLNDSWRDRAYAEWNEVRAHGCSIATWAHKNYSGLLRGIHDPPLYLYCQGDVSLMNGPGIGVVGARTSTRRGLRLAGDMSRDLAKAGVTVVSGLAYGIDREAHLGGLEGPGSSVAVLGAGLGMDYPKGNRDVRALLEKTGLVVTEYPPNKRAEPRHFPVRNRIISGMSLGVLVVEAAMRSGALITARNALEQGREVFAVPGPHGSEPHAGCNSLIDQGAHKVESAEQILAELLPYLTHRLKDGEEPWGEAGADTYITARSLPEDPELAGGRFCGTTWEGPPLHVDVPRPRQARRPRAPGRLKQERVEPDRMSLGHEDLPRESERELDPEESEVLAALKHEQRLHIDALGQTLGWEAGRVSRVLIHMELRGLVRQWPGMLYGAA